MSKVRVLVGLALVSTVVAVLSPWTPATGAQGERTLKYSAKFSELQQTEVDADDSGSVEVGDYFVGGFVLRRGGRARGHLEFRCDIVRSGPHRELCHGVVHIDGMGEFVVDDVSNAANETEKVAITGGTGQFGGAIGNGFLDFRGSRALFTFHVR